MSVPERTSEHPPNAGVSPDDTVPQGVFPDPVDLSDPAVFAGLTGLTPLTSPPTAPERSPERRSALAEASRLLVETLGATPTTLQSCGATDTDRAHLTAHLGRHALQGCPTRDFKKAWRTTTDGASVPKMYRVGHPSLSRMQYVALTHKQYAAVIVVDVDRYGTDGGGVDNIHPEAYRTIARLAGVGAGPAWIGVNPANGKAQMIWLIDPVHADGSGESANMRLLKATAATLGTALGGDPAFAHNLSRSPLYTGADPTAYRWHCQHHLVARLSSLIEEVRAMTGDTAPQAARTQQKYTSGRELLEAVKARRSEAEAFKAMASDLDGDLPSATAMDTDRIDGVKVLWITEGRAARDETAFRHALAEAHRLRAAGKRMSDAAIIDAYERAYGIAQAIGADGRTEDIPPMRDRQTMARRVRGYVIAGKTSHSVSGGPAATGRASTRERKALATMGRRGGKKAAQRWQDDPDGDYAEQERFKLRKSNLRRGQQGKTRRLRIAAWFLEGVSETGEWPTVSEAADSFQVSERTVRSAIQEAGISLPRGRRKKPATP
ncbi:replication initiation protein [Candidatus Corynebacterium faecigallinarum]|uniref:replication initiation protein n=1 Tax=Candidatus Corynebacterium faecigallinarum TaxID=2838528 RepID=UPI003FD34AD4